MYPISPPKYFSKEYPSVGKKTSYVSRTWRAQKAPFIFRLPYSMDSARVTQAVNYWPSYDQGGHTYWMDDANMRKVYNAAYRTFIQKMKAHQAQWLLNMVERQKSFSMIRERSLRLAVGLIYARRGDLKGLRRQWGSGAGLRRNLRKQGSHILEYSFGWAPLVGDIFNAMATFAEGIPPPVIRARKSWEETVLNRSNYPWYERKTSVRNIDRRVQLIGNVRVDCPFLALANQLGLINPLVVAYEATPWSFVVNYFVNLDDWLGSFTDFVGFELTNSATTYIGKSTVTNTLAYDAALKLPTEIWSIEQFTMNRVAGINRPTLRGRLPWQLSVQRAATSVGLLLQQLK